MVTHGASAPGQNPAYRPTHRHQIPGFASSALARRSPRSEAIVTGRSVPPLRPLLRRSAWVRIVLLPAASADGKRAIWRDHDGSQRSESFDRKGDAQKHLATVEADLLRGTYVDPRAGQTSLAEYATDWMSKQEWRHSTRSLAESHMRNHIGPRQGKRPLGSITRTDVQGFVTSLGRGDDALSPKTIDSIYRRLVSILEAAVYDRKIARSPAVEPTEIDDDDGVLG